MAENRPDLTDEQRAAMRALGWSPATYEEEARLARIGDDLAGIGRDLEAHLAISPDERTIAAAFGAVTDADVRTMIARYRERSR